MSSGEALRSMSSNETEPGGFLPTKTTTWHGKGRSDKEDDNYDDDDDDDDDEDDDDDDDDGDDDDGHDDDDDIRHGMIMFSFGVTTGKIL